MERLITILLFCYLVLFPFGQLTRVPGILGPEVNLYLTDVFLFLLLLSWGTWRLKQRQKKYQLSPLAMPIFFFSIISFLSLALTTPLFLNREMVVAGLYWLRWLVYAGLYFTVFDIKKRFKYLGRQNGVNLLIVIGTATAIFGLIQYLLWPNLKALEVIDWDPHFYRVVGTFLDPGFLGLILVLTFILILASYFEREDHGFYPWMEREKQTRRPSESEGRIPRALPVVVYLEKRNLWLFLAGGLVCAALALTYSRASYLAYLVGIGIIAGLRKRPKIFLVLLAMGMVTLFFLPRPGGEGGKLSRTYSIGSRLESWRQALVIFRDHPLLGVGFNAYRYSQRDYGFLEGEKWLTSHAGAGVDSSWFFVLATTGITGFIFYSWLWLKALKNTRNPIIISSLAAAFIHALFNNSLFYPWIMAWLWLLLAIG